MRLEVLEEIHHGFIFKRRRVGHIDDDVSAGHRSDETFAGEGIDARGRRGGGYVVTELAESGDEFGSDETGVADHDNLQIFSRTILCSI